MRAKASPRQKLIDRLNRGWTEFRESYAGLPDAELQEPGALGEWSVKDVITHIAIWEEEALKHLPTIAAGGTPPRYAAVGGIDAFNDRMIESRRQLSLDNVRRDAEETHERLVDYLMTVPEELLAGTSRFRRRLRLDTYGHYPLHSDALRAWRGVRQKRV